MELFNLSPIISIGIVCILALLVDPLSKGKFGLLYWFSIIGLIVTGVFSVLTINFNPSEITSMAQMPISKGMVTFGRYASFLDLLFVLGGLFTLFAARPYFQKQNWETNEFYTLILYAVSGMMIISHSNHLLMLFVGIEIMSITFYVLAGYFRFTLKSVEASLKYFLLGSFATGFLLYGMSMIYGATGTMYLQDMQTGVSIATAIKSGMINNQAFLAIGFAMLIVGLSFKAAAFPFHQWAPDVYTGSPTVITAFMSTAGKAAALIAFIIIAKALIPIGITNPDILVLTQKGQMVIAIISAITMLIGNITALVQKNIKRMLAYSSVAHAGYLLIGVAANNEKGWTGIIFYLSAYLLMQVGSFVVLSVLEQKTDQKLELEDYAGLYKKFPVLSAIMSIFMFSLAGLPPFAGFFGKYYLFTAAIEAGFTWLTIVAVISSIISIAFYIGLVVWIYFKEPKEELEAHYGSASITLFLTTVGIIVLGVLPSYLQSIITKFLN